MVLHLSMYFLWILSFNVVSDSQSHRLPQMEHIVSDIRHISNIDGSMGLPSFHCDGASQSATWPTCSWLVTIEFGQQRMSHKSRVEQRTVDEEHLKDKETILWCGGLDRKFRCPKCFFGCASAIKKSISTQTHRPGGSHLSMGFLGFSMFFSLSNPYPNSKSNQSNLSIIYPSFHHHLPIIYPSSTHLPFFRLVQHGHLVWPFSALRCPPSSPPRLSAMEAIVNLSVGCPGNRWDL